MGWVRGMYIKRFGRDLPFPRLRGPAMRGLTLGEPNPMQLITDPEKKAFYRAEFKRMTGRDLPIPLDEQTAGDELAGVETSLSVESPLRLVTDPAERDRMEQRYIELFGEPLPKPPGQ